MASIVWLTAAVGMAAGAGLPILAIAVTCAHFIVVFIFPAIEISFRKSESMLCFSSRESGSTSREAHLLPGGTKK